MQRCKVLFEQPAHTAAMFKLCLFLLCLLLSPITWSKDRLMTVSVRNSETISYWWMPKEGALATVVLFPGGNGGMGYRDGVPASGNFLVRSREAFRAEGFNVAILGNPSDKRQLDDAWRMSAAHLSDIRSVMDDIQRQGAAQPIWLVGTSRGTVSVAAAAIGLSGSIAGAVLTASITSPQLASAVSRQDIGQITVPVLVYHHEDDACRVTRAAETAQIMPLLRQAPVKKRLIVSGGENPSGAPCEAFHWHGFVGMEERAVKDIGGWIKDPRP